MALLVSGAAAASEPVGGSIYSCVDASGRKLTSDRPIAACLDREQRELGPSGNVRRVLGPSLTEHERAAKAAQLRKEQEERNRAIEERRRERVLVARYPNKAAHDVERVAALETADSVKELAVRRTQELQARRKALVSEMEFYQRDPAKAPMKLRRDLAENEADLEEQQRLMAGQEQEKRRIHERFDKELSHLRELWAARAPVSTVLPDGEAAR